MGRPEARIPEHQPMKALADYLRQLRRALGSPSYRRLGALVHVEQQSLSQTANGNRVGWGRVLLYVQALRAYNPQAVTVTELATLKQLHQVGEQQHRVAATGSLRRRQSVAFWAEVDSVTAVAAHTTARHRPPGQWELTPGITDGARLNAAHTVDGLYIVLVDVAASCHIDLLQPNRSKLRSTPDDFSWFGETHTDRARPIPEVRHPSELTRVVLVDVVRLCGGTEGDCSAWLAAWDRLHRTAPGDGPSRLPPSAGRLPMRPSARQRPPQDSSLSDWPGHVMRRPVALGRLAT